MKIRMYPYKMGSAGASRLIKALGGKRIKLLNSKYRGYTTHLVINWGNVNIPGWDRRGIHWLNHPVNIKNASNKATFFNLTDGMGVLEHTFNKATAATWFVDDKSTVYCRTTTSGHSGEGIVVAHNADELVNAPLYTRGVHKAREYRAHYNKWNGVFLLYQKRRKNGTDATSEVKTHDNGWIMSATDVTPPPENYKQICANIMNQINLDFGVVDFLVKDGEVKVIEVNTAPGIEGSTVDIYQRQFEDYIQQAR